ncbi:hypothetical protein [Agromyces lapidis]|uniref:HD domain-containing protein n=1 Tax=Agromyces lapidis TaxID=279574 RepID=A0ABV5SLS8_9MICO|nr:hypothetical protein [Agromyces lapidis]
MPGLPGAAEPESRAARRSAELGGTLRPRRMPDRASVWAPPAPEQGGGAAGSPAAVSPVPPAVPAQVPPAAVPAEVERYYLCCEVPSGDFVEVILAVSDGGRRRYFTTSDGDRLAEVDEYYFVRRSLGDARSMLELDAREMAELEAELNFVRPLRGRDPLAELAAEAAGGAPAPEITTADATQPTAPQTPIDSVVAAETPSAPEPTTEVAPVVGPTPVAEAAAPAPVADPAARVDAAAHAVPGPVEPAAPASPAAPAEPAPAAESPRSAEAPPVAEPAPGASVPQPTAAPETDAEAWAELLRRAGFEPPEFGLDQVDAEPAEPEPAPAPVSHPDALMTEPVLMQWAETIDRQPEPEPSPEVIAESASASEALPVNEPSPAAEAAADTAPAPAAVPTSSPEAEAEAAAEAATTPGVAPAPETEPSPVSAPETAATHPDLAPPAPLAPPKLSLVPEPPVVAPVVSTPRLTLVPGPPPEQPPTPASAFPPIAEVIPEAVPAPDAAPASDPDSNEETNPVAMMTNPTDALAPAASVTPIAAPAALHSAPARAVDADTAAQVALAKGIAFVAHRGQVDQVGADYIDHPGRVAEHFDAATEPVATAAAWLHDVVERSAVSEQELLEAGVRPDIVEIVVLLTRTSGMSDDEYFARIRSNPLARRVKLADVADNSSPWRVRKLDYDAQQRLAAKYRHAREALG